MKKHDGQSSIAKLGGKSEIFTDRGDTSGMKGTLAGSSSLICLLLSTFTTHRSEAVEKIIGRDKKLFLTSKLSFAVNGSSSSVSSAS